MNDTYRTDQVGARQYKDVSGNPCSLSWLVRNEPEWAANQIRNRDKLERELNAANERIKQIESDAYLRSRQMRRMEEIGDKMAEWLKCERNLGNDTFTAHLWDEAKKPLNDRS